MEFDLFTCILCLCAYFAIFALITFVYYKMLLNFVDYVGKKTKAIIFILAAIWPASLIPAMIVFIMGLLVIWFKYDIK